MLNRSVSNRVLLALDLSAMAFSLNKCRCIMRNTHSIRVTVISVVNLGCKLLSWQDSKIVLAQEYFVAFPDILWEVTHHNLIAEWVRDQKHAHLFFYCLSFRFSNAVFILDKWIVKEILNLFTRNERNVVLSHARSLPHFFLYFTWLFKHKTVLMYNFHSYLFESIIEEIELSYSRVWGTTRTMTLKTTIYPR